MAINVDISKITGINQVGNSYQRKSAVPLDYYSLFNTKAEAEAYAASNPVAYVGQVISYIDNGEVKVCVIANAAGLLKEVGTAPVGDGKTIEVSAEGAVALLGAAGAANGTLPILEDGALVWKTLGEVTEDHNTTYEFAKNENGTGLIITPVVNGSPVDDDKVIVDFDEKFTTHDEMVVAIAGAAYSVDSNILKLENKTLSTALSFNYDNSNRKIQLLGLNNTVVAELDASAFVVDGVLQDVEYVPTSRKLIFTWNIITGFDGETPIYKTDEVDVSDLVDTYSAGAGLSLNSNEFAIKLADSCEFLTIDENGALMLSGINQAIADAVAPLATQESVNGLTERVNALDSAETGVIAVINEKLETIEENAQVNVIEKITINGVEINPTDKVINITLPEASNEVAGTVKLSNEVGINEETKALEIKELDVNKLVQTDWLILSGGTAAEDIN